MNEFWKIKLEKSHRDFMNIVWPKINNWFPLGNLIAVETKMQNDLARLFDTRAGIDMWKIDPLGLRGIASRIQWQSNPPRSTFPDKTFTIRKIRADGFKTEFQKRQEAIKRGYVYPYWTIHAYIDEGCLLYACCIETKELFFAYEFCPEIFKENTNREDGNTFLYVYAEDLKNNNFGNVKIYDLKE